MSNESCFFQGLVLICAVGAFGATGTNYFPVAKPGIGTGLPESIATMGSKALDRMREPRLWLSKTTATNTIYRLTILPTWGNAISIRVQTGGDDFKLFARRLTGDAGYNPGRLVEQVDTVLTRRDSLTLRKLLQSLMPLEMPTQGNQLTGFDGEEWILECIEDGRYHFLERWSITVETKQRHLEDFLAVATFLVDKSELRSRPSNRGQELLPAPGESKHSKR